MDRLTPAQIEHLFSVARELDAAPACGGRRGEIIARSAKTLGCAEKTVYAHLRRYTGWTCGRKTRADAGTTCVDRDLALQAGGLVYLTRRQNGKRLLSHKTACRILAAQGIGVVNEATGEVTMPSPETVSRAMRRHGCHPAQLAAGTPAQRLRSLHPNHVWQVDASVCVLYRLKGSPAIRLLNERDYNAHKPGKLIEIAGQRIVRYVVADHTSNCLYVHYEQAKGEDALGVITTLMEAMCDRGPRDPMHGVPYLIYMDKGSGNKSSLVTQFLKRLTITPLYHAAGSARATGSVEQAQNAVECGFESRLRFMDIDDIAALQARADAWRCHFNAHAVHTRLRCPRNEAWIRIPDDKLRTVTRSVLEAVAAWGDVTRQVGDSFRISVDTKIAGRHEYDLRDMAVHGLTSKDTVTVRLNPFRAPVITVLAIRPDGQELMFDVPPIEKDAANFDAAAPIIGEEFRSLPETMAEKNIKEIKQRAYGTDDVAEAEKAHKARNRTPYADIDIMADVTDAPLYLRKKGATLDVETKTAAPVPLNHAQAAVRLRSLCGTAWDADPTACMDLLKTRYPDRVPEDKLDELAAAVRDRFAPHPAAIIAMPKTTIRNATCAS